MTVDIPSSRGGVAPTSPTRGQASSPTASPPKPKTTPNAAAQQPSAEPTQSASQPQAESALESSEADPERSVHGGDGGANPDSSSAQAADKDTTGAIQDEPLNGRSGTNATAAYIRSLDGMDTGAFECIFRDVTRPPGGALWPSFGSAASDCLALQCTALKLPPKPSPARHMIGGKSCVASLNNASAAPTSAAAVAAARAYSRSPSPTRTHTIVYDDDQGAASSTSPRSRHSLTLPASTAVTANAVAAAAAAVLRKAGKVAPNSAAGSQAGGTAVCSVCYDESLPVDVHDSQKPRLALNIQNSSRAQTPSNLDLADASARKVSNATEHYICSSAAAGTTSADMPHGLEKADSMGDIGDADSQQDFHAASAGKGGEVGTDDAKLRLSANELREKARRHHQAAGDAAVPDILHCIDSTVTEGVYFSH